jgi:hypothetical protein
MEGDGKLLFTIISNDDHNNHDTWWSLIYVDRFRHALQGFRIWSHSLATQDWRRGWRQAILNPKHNSEDQNVVHKRAPYNRVEEFQKWRGEKPPREVGHRIRVRLTISFIFGWMMSNFSSIPREAMRTQLILLNIHPKILIFSPYIFLLKGNGPYFIPIYFTCNGIMYFNWTLHYLEFVYNFYVKWFKSSLYYAARRF